MAPRSGGTVHVSRQHGGRRDTSVWCGATRRFEKRSPHGIEDRENALWCASDYVDWLLAAHGGAQLHILQQLAGVLISLADEPRSRRRLDVTNGSPTPRVTSFTASRLLNEWQRHRAVLKRRGGCDPARADPAGRIDRLNSIVASSACSTLRCRNDTAFASCHLHLLFGRNRPWEGVVDDLSAVRVLEVDASPHWRAFVTAQLRERSMQVVGTACVDGLDAVDKASQLQAGCGHSSMSGCPAGSTAWDATRRIHGRASDEDPHRRQRRARSDIIQAAFAADARECG